MENKEFNAADFQKGINKIGIFCLLIAMIGVASILCGFFVGATPELGLDGDGGGLIGGEEDPTAGVEDPADYYGTYYTVDEEEYITVTFRADGTCTYSKSNGITGRDGEDAYKVEETYEYVYTSGDYIDEHVMVTYTEYAENDTGAILIYLKNGFVCVLWVTETEPYTFVLDDTGATFTTERYDLEERMADPKDYYGKYVASKNTYLVLSEGNTAELSWNGEKSERLYVYVNREWTERYTYYSFEEAIIVYEEGSDQFMTFEYDRTAGVMKCMTSTDEIVFEPEEIAVDPADYYGTYYSSEDFEYRTVEIKSDGTCTVTAGNGLAGNAKVYEYEYEFVSGQYALQNYDISCDDYAENGALLLRDGQTTEIYWIKTDSPYSFYNERGDYTLTTEEYDFEESMGDPKDYYGIYRYDGDAVYVSLSENGQAIFVNGESEQLLCAYVKRGWIEKYTTRSCNEAIILYGYGGNEFYFFEITQDSNLIYRSGYAAYPFTKE